MSYDKEQVLMKDESTKKIIDEPTADSAFNKGLDPQLAEVVRNELIRQQDHVELIASENYVSEAVLKLAGSVLTNKYAEGYPHARYYNGCKYIDVAEDLARDRLKQLFNCGHQPGEKFTDANGRE